MLNRPIHFAPYLKSVIWGGSRIPSYKGIATDLAAIGESWEISAVPGHVSMVDSGPYEGATLTELIERFGPELLGRRVYERFGTAFPLLIKLIDADGDLSVQVHPDDALAMKRHHCAGKTEMWHVIETRPGAKIHVGLSAPLTPAEYERRVADGTIMDVIATYDSAPGDTFFLPAGRIHAIGAGNLLAEIQQTSDITYRIYDFGRVDKDGHPRELHTELAKDAIDYTVLPDYRTTPRGNDLVSCPYFDVHRLELTADATEIPQPLDSFTILMCLRGQAAVTGPDGDTDTISQGDTVLYPATARPLTATGPGALLLSVQC